MSKPPEKILGATKLVRAVRPLVYKGTEYRGRQHARVDGKDGSYEIIETHPGDEFECEAAWAKQAENAGEVVLLSGGRVTVTEQKDGFHTYESWIHNLSDPAPVYERCELLQPLWFSPGCHLPVGTKCRLDTAAFFDRARFCYEGEEQTDAHATRILRPSPKRVKQVAVEQSIMIAQLMAQVFPEKA